MILASAPTLLCCFSLPVVCLIPSLIGTYSDEGPKVPTDIKKKKNAKSTTGPTDPLINKNAAAARSHTFQISSSKHTHWEESTV